jgi:hypothetical protein
MPGEPVLRRKVRIAGALLLLSALSTVLFIGHGVAPSGFILVVLLGFGGAAGAVCGGLALVLYGVSGKGALAVAWIIVLVLGAAECLVIRMSDWRIATALSNIPFAVCSCWYLAQVHRMARSVRYGVGTGTHP